MEAREGEFSRIKAVMPSIFTLSIFLDFGFRPRFHAKGRASWTFLSSYTSAFNTILPLLYSQ